MNRIDLFLDLPDIDRYQTLLEQFLTGRLDAAEFASERLRRGIYAQRQEGWYMVRTRITAGALDANQLRGLARAVRRHSGLDEAHITTRQDLQLYHIPLQQTPDLLRMLVRHGVTTQSAGGNTVRNVTICPLAGACPGELLDVEPHARAVSRHFLHHPLNTSLPRKVKIAFSGCSADCAAGQVHDLAFIATTGPRGEPGFRVLAAGGLGARPQAALVLEPFIEESDVIPVIEAMLLVHDRHSDRNRKSRSRLKFLPGILGRQEFLEAYRKELERTRAAYDPTGAPSPPRLKTRPSPAGSRLPAAPGTPFPMNGSAGQLAVPVTVPGGVLRSAQLAALARLLDNELASRVRLTREQNLLLLGVPRQRLTDCLELLEHIGLPPGNREKVVSCPGTNTCPLAITASRKMARLAARAAPGLQLGISGCHNGCAGSEIADIGLTGKARRHHGHLIPTYSFRLGGGHIAGIIAPDIPAVRVPAALRRIQENYAASRRDEESFRDWCHRRGEVHFRALLAPLARVQPDETPFLARDHGDSSIFRVNAAGTGECAGNQASSIERQLASAQWEYSLARAFFDKQKHAEAGACLHNGLTLAGNALLEAATGKPAEIGGRPDATSEAVLSGEDSHLGQAFMRLNRRLRDFRTDPDESLLPTLMQESECWLEEVRTRCRELRAARRRATPASARAGSHGPPPER